MFLKLERITNLVNTNANPVNTTKKLGGSITEFVLVQLK